MNKSYIYLLVLIALAQAQNASQGTEGFYISPHGLTREIEVNEALGKVASRFTVSKTTYYKGSASYTGDNYTVELAYLDGKQTINIVGSDEVEVSGGRIEIFLTLNFTKVDQGKTTNGYATGSVISDSLNYTKGLIFDKEGLLRWTLVPGPRAFKNLTIFNKFRIKRIQPYNETDLQALDEMIDGSGGAVTPSTAQSQILEKFNSIMPQTLNTTLNAYILGPQIDYHFEHPTLGRLTMSIIHHLFGFSINATDGYKVIYLTEIKDWPEPVCNGINVPDKHLTWELNGGAQNIHLICLYQEVVEFMQKKGWLDTKLNIGWDSNAFQFYAGDLYELINNLYLTISPRELLEGECKASADKLSIKHGRETRNNILTLTVSYGCTVRSRNKTLSYVDVMNFNADVRFLIEPKANKIDLDFSIHDAEIIDMQFKPVGQYYVGNINLALFKANQVMKMMRGVKVFGTGFPTLARSMPYTEVTENYVLYSDKSHLSFTPTPGVLEL